MKGKPLSVALAVLLLAGAGSAPAAAAPLTAGVLRPSPSLPAGPVTVGDQASLGRLAVSNLEPQAPADPRGLTAVALNAVSGLSSLKPSSSRLLLSSAVTPPPSAPSLYSRVVELAETYRVTVLTGRPADGRTVPSPARQGSWPRLEVPDARLALSRSAADHLAELGGIRLSGRLASSDEDSTAYDLVATVPLIPSKVDVSARYRLVDVDRLAGAAAAARQPQTVGVGGRLALNGGTLLKAEYELTRDGGALTGTRTDAGVSLRLDPRTDLSAGLSLGRSATQGDEVRTSLGLGYRLSNDVSLRASYTLINFGDGPAPKPGEGRHQASAELSLRF